MPASTCGRDGSSTSAAAWDTAITCSDRETVGVDLEPEALIGQDRETVAADMRDLPFADGSFPSVLSVQSLEHVPDPERVIAEVVRVLEPDGVAMFVTPNRLTSAGPTRSSIPTTTSSSTARSCEPSARRASSEVEILGLFGSDRYMEIFDEERATLDRTLRVTRCGSAGSFR